MKTHCYKLCYFRLDQVLKVELCFGVNTTRKTSNASKVNLSRKVDTENHYNLKAQIGFCTELVFCCPKPAEAVSVKSKTSDRIKHGADFIILRAKLVFTYLLEYSMAASAAHPS